MLAEVEEAFGRYMIIKTQFINMNFVSSTVRKCCNPGFRKQIELFESRSTIQVESPSLLKVELRYVYDLALRIELEVEGSLKINLPDVGIWIGI